MGPQTVQGRLREWSRVRNLPPVNVWPSESALYAVLRNPGRATGGKSDGGLSALVAKASGAMKALIRSHEVAEKVGLLPAKERRVIEAMYVVPVTKLPRSIRDAAKLLSMAPMTYHGRLLKAEEMLTQALELGCTVNPYSVGSPTVDSELRTKSGQAPVFFRHDPASSSRKSPVARAVPGIESRLATIDRKPRPLLRLKARSTAG